MVKILKPFTIAEKSLQKYAIDYVADSLVFYDTRSAILLGEIEYLPKEDAFVKLLSSLVAEDPLFTISVNKTMLTNLLAFVKEDYIDVKIELAGAEIGIGYKHDSYCLTVNGIQIDLYYLKMFKTMINEKRFQFDWVFPKGTKHSYLMGEGHYFIMPHVIHHPL
jgi:hypothetical protein